jgi:rRNA maturation endonuclease Nob1
LENLFGIGVEVHTTINVVDELNEKQQAMLSKLIGKKVITVHQLDEMNVPETIHRSNRLSESDKSVFCLAIQLDAFILTGDGVVRKISGVQKIEVHGMLWLFDRFIENKLVTKKVASAHLKQLMGYNSRLPKQDCEKRLAEWK